MSPASLAIAHRPHLDYRRIAAMGIAMTLNLAVIVIASRPITPPRLSATAKPISVPLIHIIDPPAKVQPPQPIVLKPLAHPLTNVHPRPSPVTKTTPTTIPVIDNTTVPTVTGPAVPAIDNHPGGAVAGTPVEAQLAYRSAPLQFPAVALREHMQGTVLLDVLVDETGKPVDVKVEHGSGYALLDRSAREQVLAAWRFEPAMVNGQAVRAWARVPVSFDLRAQ